MCELITVISLDTPQGVVFIASVYLPLTTRSAYGEEDLLERLRKVLYNFKHVRRAERIIVGGDLNAKSEVWGSTNEDRRAATIVVPLEEF